ncbi:phage tail assembly chaperone [Pseudomonas syringae]|uniref:phage tail assembly chaperone n=1 Tax=Pseudomonas syringae TaxID=317 RepID=UPI003F756E4F
MAKITVPPDFDLVKIATAAGQPDLEKRSYHNGVLEVMGVTQAKLSAALASYNYFETEVEVAAQNAAAERDQLLVAADKATAGMSDAFIAGLLSEDEITLFRSFASYKLALRNIERQPDYPSFIDWPAIPS